MKKAKSKPAKVALPYMFEYYNIHAYQTIGVKSTLARILNALGDAVQERPRLPRFLLVIMDKDVMADFDLFDDEDFNPKKDFTKALMYFAKELNLILKRKRLAIQASKPGAVYGDHPQVIYVKVLRRPDAK